MVEYLKYQRGTGSRVEITRLKTTREEEEIFKERADNLSDPRGFSCASSVSSVLAGYCAITRTWRPGVLGDMVKEANENKEKGTCPKK